MANPLLLQHMPVGYRFRPTDEELISHYLTHKLNGQNFVLHVIPELNIYKHEPWDLPAFSKIHSEDPEWFFFCPRVFKYSRKKKLVDRATPRGFWKATGTDRKIKVRGGDEVIGTKKTLVFYQGRLPHAVKTNWVIHEYQALAFPDQPGSFVLCKLKKNCDEAEKRMDRDEEEPSVTPNSEIRASESRIADVHSSPSNNLDSIFEAHPTDDVDFNMLLFSSFVNEHESSLQFSPTINSNAGNDIGSVNLPLTTEEEDNADNFMNSTLNMPFVTSEEEDDADQFVNSILNLPVETTEEEGNADKFMNLFSYDDDEEVGMIASIQALTPWESSDTEVENVSAQCGYTYRNGQREHLLQAEVNSSVVSYNQGAKHENEGRHLQDDLDSSSVDSTHVRPLRINRIKHLSSGSTLKTWKTQCQPRSAESVSRTVGTRRFQSHRNVSTKGAYHEGQKETLDHPNKNKREALVTDKRNALKASSSESSGVNGKSSLVQLEKPSSSQNLSAPSVYLGNVVIGLLLFIVIIWEILSCGNSC